MNTSVIRALKKQVDDLKIATYNRAQAIAGYESQLERAQNEQDSDMEQIEILRAAVREMGGDPDEQSEQ